MPDNPRLLDLARYVALHIKEYIENPTHAPVQLQLNLN